MKKKYRYIAYGWTISSDIQFPELIESDLEPDIDISIIHQQKDCPAFSDVLTFTINNVGKFIVGNGNAIYVLPLTSHLDDLRVFILGSVFGALMHMRNQLVIHGSAIEYNHQALMFCGPSGSGKSTMAGMFIKHGFSFISDDVCLIKFDTQGVLVQPSYPQLKLHSDVVKDLNLTLPSTNKNTPEGEKEKYFITEQNYLQPLVLHNLFILHRNGLSTIIKEVKGSEKFNTLAEQTFRLGFINELKHHSIFFSQLADLASRIKLYNIYYPNDIKKLQQVLQAIIQSVL